MAYLVTGGTGFVGTYVARLLIHDQEKVVAYDATPDRNLMEMIIGKGKSDQIQVVRGDITDLPYLIHTCRQYQVDRIIHTAAILNSKNPYSVMHVNCDGTIKVLEAARILGMKKVVLTSSNAVFGAAKQYGEEFIPNNAPYCPSSIYGASKVFNEACARHYFNEYGLDTVVIRFTYVYGLNRTGGKGRTFADELFMKPALGMPGKVPLSDSIHNWLYVEDAAKALVMASKVGPTKTRSFTAASEFRSVAEVAAYVKSLIPEADITLLPGSFGLGYKFDTTEIKEELGWQPEYTIEKAIKKVVEYLRENRQEQAVFP